MLPPLYVNQIEVSRKEGKVHDAAVSSSSLIFRSILEGGLPILNPLGGPTLSAVSSGMLFPGLQLLCNSLDVLAERSPERDWAARLGVEDYIFPESLGLNLVRMSHSI